MKTIRVVAAGGCDIDLEDWRGVAWDKVSVYRHEGKRHE